MATEATGHLQTALDELEETMSKDRYKLPKGWVWTKLSNVAEIIMGQSPPRFILHYLRHIEEELSKKGQGSTFTVISCDDLRILPFPLPLLQEQLFIVNRIQEFFSLAEAIEKSVKIAQDNCEKLTQPVLAKAFRGELVKQDPSDEPAEKLLKRVKLKEK